MRTKKAIGVSILVFAAAILGYYFLCHSARSLPRTGSTRNSPRLFVGEFRPYPVNAWFAPFPTPTGAVVTFGPQLDQSSIAALFMQDPQPDARIKVLQRPRVQMPKE